ncbi:MAG: PspA/IM30 family protein [Planctomycetaceae bacterium]
MPHFSRLTDIITCSLTEILESSEDPETTLREVLREMQEGLSSARRVAGTSATNRDRLQQEVTEHQQQAEHWFSQARTALASGDETAAREALTRKVEIEDLIDGLKPELDAAISTYNNMLRIQKALEARYAEASRRMADLTGTANEVPLESETAIHAITRSQSEKNSEVEAELDALRKQLKSD